MNVKKERHARERVTAFAYECDASPVCHNDPRPHTSNDTRVLKWRGQGYSLDDVLAEATSVAGMQKATRHTFDY
jgi:hypothetical protein